MFNLDPSFEIGFKVHSIAVNVEDQSRIPRALELRSADSVY